MKIHSKIIRNIELPSCKNCIHYRPQRFDSDFTSPFNKCDKFGYKDVVTDKITYYYADACRTDELKCGQKGVHFEKEPRMFLKKLKHRMFRPSTLFWTGAIVYLVVYYIKVVLENSCTK